MFGLINMSHLARVVRSFSCHKSSEIPRHSMYAIYAYTYIDPQNHPKPPLAVSRQSVLAARSCPLYRVATRCHHSAHRPSRSVALRAHRPIVTPPVLVLTASSSRCAPEKPRRGAGPAPPQLCAAGPTAWPMWESIIASNVFKRC